MTRESEAEEPKKGCSSSMASWCVVLTFLAVAAGLGVWVWNIAQDHKVHEAKLTTELAQVKGKLSQAQTALFVCEGLRKNKPSCEEKKPLRKKGAHRVASAKPKVSPMPKVVPLYPVVKAPVEESKFDPSTCGEGTEPVIDRASGKPYCRAIVAPAPVSSAQPAVAENTPPEPAHKASRGCYYDERGRKMCPASMVPAEYREYRVSDGEHALKCGAGGAVLGALTADNRKGALAGLVAGALGSLGGSAFGNRDVGCAAGVGIGVARAYSYRYDRHYAPPAAAPLSATPPVWVTNPGSGSPPPVLATNPGTNRVPPAWVTN